MKTFKERLELIGQSIAQQIQYSLCWDEPLNGDDIDDLVNAFKNELMELNGEN